MSAMEYAFSSGVWYPGRLPFNRMRSGPLGGIGGSAVTRLADVVSQPATPPNVAATPAAAPVFRIVRLEIDFFFMPLSSRGFTGPERKAVRHRQAVSARLLRAMHGFPG